jgi:hypothetical protein
MTRVEFRYSGLLDARDAASELMVGGNRKRAVTIPEACVLQASADLLTVQESIYGLEVAKLLRAQHTSVYSILKRLTDQDLVFDEPEIEIKDYAAANDRPRRHLYTPTDYGHQVLELFR